VVSVGVAEAVSCIGRLLLSCCFTITHLQAGPFLPLRLLTHCPLFVSHPFAPKFAYWSRDLTSRTLLEIHRSCAHWRKLETFSHRHSTRAKRIRNGLEVIRKTCDDWISFDRVTWWTRSSYRSVSERSSIEDYTGCQEQPGNNTGRKSSHNKATLS
jgi:hypothetical protein